jgi:hypothetical protein
MNILEEIYDKKSKEMEYSNIEEYITKILRIMNNNDYITVKYNFVDKYIEIIDKKYRDIILEEYNKNNLFIKYKNYNKFILEDDLIIYLTAFSYKKNKEIFNNKINKILNEDEDILKIVNQHNKFMLKKNKKNKEIGKITEEKLINEFVEEILYKYNIFDKNKVKIVKNDYIYCYEKKYKNSEIKINENRGRQKKEVDAIIYYKNKLLCLLEVKSNPDEIGGIINTYKNYFNKYKNHYIEIINKDNKIVRQKIKENIIRRKLWILTNIDKSNRHRLYNFDIKSYMKDYMDLMNMLLFTKKKYIDKYNNFMENKQNIEILEDYINNKNKNNDNYINKIIKKYNIKFTLK